MRPLPLSITNCVSKNTPGFVLANVGSHGVLLYDW
jgi:hypothetical protein